MQQPHTQQQQQAGSDPAAAEEQQQQQQVGSTAAAAEGQQQQQGEMLQHWETLSLLFGQLGSRDARCAAADAMLALSGLLQHTSSNSSSGVATPASTPAAESAYSAVATQLVALNSWSVESLDDPDYSRRMGCYSQLQPQIWMRYSRLQALPLLLQGFFDLRNGDDLAIRQAAASALTKAVEAMAQLEQQQQGLDSEQPAEGAAAAAVVGQLGPDDPLRLLPRVLYPQAKSGLRSNNLAVRQEHAALLRQLVLALPGRFPDLLPLTSKDPEQDFFLNITHLQIHRRGRALQLLGRLAQQQQQQQQQGEEHALDEAAAAAAAKRRRVADAEGAMAAQQQQQLPQDDGEDATAAAPGHKRPRQQQQQQQHKAVSVRVLMDIASPLLQQFIMEGAGVGSSSAAAVAAAAEQRGGHIKKQSDSDREGAVADVAIDALRELCKLLGWQQYSGLLQRWLKLMTQSPKKQVIRAACAVLDAFHFPLDVEDVPEQQQQQQQQQQQGAAAMQVDEAAAATGAEDAAATGAEDAAPDEQEFSEDDDDEQQQQQADEEAAAAAAAVERAAAAADVAAAAKQLLMKRVLPVLQSQLVVDDQEVARAPVALALVKLIKVGFRGLTWGFSACVMCVRDVVFVSWLLIRRWHAHLLRLRWSK
jgi:U3 small nucleolar RNA-associated protein 20